MAAQFDGASCCLLKIVYLKINSSLWANVGMFLGYFMQTSL